MRRPPQIGPLLAVVAAAAPLAAQEPPAAAVSRLVAVESAVVRLAAAHPDAIWPGFRPDTIPVLYAVAGRGVLLLNWPPDAGPPDGFALLPGFARAFWQGADVRIAASTSTALGGRSAAQVVVAPDEGDALLVGTTVHEAFHVFERSVARAGRRFGGTENSYLVTTYPVFDARNEAGVALEGRLLARALAARTLRDRREAAREFVAAREARQRRLGREFADFEVMLDLNEGLAEYALVRSLELAEADARFPWRAQATELIADHRARLDSLTSNVRLSLRARSYAAGPAMGQLLDRLAGPSWRSDLEREDRTLQDELAEASGYRDTERALLARAAREVDTAALDRDALRGVARLRSLRRAQVDSVLAQPGLLLILRADSLPNRSFGVCGLDPQNLLQAGGGVLLHTRWLRPCGGGVAGDFRTAVVQDDAAGTFTAVVGPEDSVRVTAGGASVALGDGEARVAEALRFDAPGAALAVVRALVRKTGRTIEVTPLPR